MRIIGIEHVQLAMPRGEEEPAQFLEAERACYRRVQQVRIRSAFANPTASELVECGSLRRRLQCLEHFCDLCDVPLIRRLHPLEDCIFTLVSCAAVRPNQRTSSGMRE